jgi:BASS family bile acid:Na+ symporter
LSYLGTAVHRHLLSLVVIAYVLAAVSPGPGLWAKRSLMAEAGGMTVTVPMALLAVLLFNAGLGASAAGLRSVARRPVAVLAGVVVNLVVPLAFLAVLWFGLGAWHNEAEVGYLLLGLAVVAAMPVAGSSTAWSQNAGGNVALSLGLVLLSTLLSPITTPLVLTGINELNPGGLPALAPDGAGGFLLAAVVVPSGLGLLTRCAAGDEAVARLKPVLKLLNAAILLFLCYSNATVALPQVVANPDWDYLGLVIAAASGLCVTAFAAGWLLARGLGASESDGRSLMFGLGMNNNGTGLVLAASELGSLPWAVVPVLTYNLIQHVVAGGVSRWVGRQSRE